MGRGGTLTLSPPKFVFYRLPALLPAALCVEKRRTPEARTPTPDFRESFLWRPCILRLRMSGEPARRLLCRGFVSSGLAAVGSLFLGGSPPERVRAISIARLWTSPPLHLRPINVIVSDGPVRRSYLGEGFVLRCFQHLSFPDAATRPCTWRYNRLTGGLSNTVLSY